MRFSDLSQDERAMLRLLSKQDHWSLTDPLFRGRGGATLTRLRLRGLLRHRVVQSDSRYSSVGLKDVAFRLVHDAEVGA